MTLSKRILLMFVAIMLIGSLFMSLRSIIKTEPAISDYPAGLLKADPVIVIDPGHGGADGGAVGGNGSVIEKDINLAICLTMRDVFSVNGFDVVMTRDSDISVHDEGVKGTRKQKTSDLHNRLAVAQSYPDAVFLSVHQNKFSSKSSKGAQIFYGPNNSQSVRLASILQDNFRSMLQPENTRKYKKAGKNLYLMYNAECPAVLVECGFLSNQDEAARLIRPEYQSQIAFTIFCSVMSFLGLDGLSAS